MGANKAKARPIIFLVRAASEFESEFFHAEWPHRRASGIHIEIHQQCRWRIAIMIRLLITIIVITRIRHTPDALKYTLSLHTSRILIKSISANAMPTHDSQRIHSRQPDTHARVHALRTTDAMRQHAAQSRSQPLLRCDPLKRPSPPSLCARTRGINVL